MSGVLLILALQVAPGSAACDPTLYERPVQTPMSVPPAMVDRGGALAAIEREAGSVGALPDGAEVRVWLLIDTRGRVDAAQFDQPQVEKVPLTPADSAALKAARSFRFHPAHHNGRPVCVWIRVPVRIPPRVSDLRHR